MFTVIQVVNNASSRREDKILEGFSKDELPDADSYGYHRKCYQEYTNKEKLRRLEEKRQKEKSNNIEPRQSSRTASSGLFLFMWDNPASMNKFFSDRDERTEWIALQVQI